MLVSSLDDVENGSIPPWAKPCSSDPNTIINEPTIIDQRLPNFWLIHGAKGTPIIAPRGYTDWRRPLSCGEIVGFPLASFVPSVKTMEVQFLEYYEKFGWRVHLFQGSENCNALIIVESNPEVISTPMQTRNRKKYMYRRLGFLYHGVLSCSTKCVTIGSESPSWAPIVIEGVGTVLLF